MIRFWQAFRDYKHGKDRTLRAAEAELEAALGVRFGLAPNPRMQPTGRSSAVLRAGGEAP